MIRLLIVFILSLVNASLLNVSLFCEPGLSAGRPFLTTKKTFWDQQKKGTNFFNAQEHPQRFKMARDLGVQFIRLAPNKWLNGRPPQKRGDFLLGDKDAYTGIIKADLAYLKKVLDWAEASGQKVIVTMLSLPGNRWKQHNNGVQERKIWTDPTSQDQAIAFWVELARHLKGHPALVGYNIKNEPSPERAQVVLSDWFTGDYEHWYRRVKGSPADLNRFYKTAVAAIRRVDSDTAIILDSGYYASPWAFKVLEPVADEHVLYSFHMYEPYAFTSHTNKGRFLYPGSIPTGEHAQAPRHTWNLDAMRRFFDPVAAWQKKYNVPNNRILVGEFGVFRRNAGAVSYMKDVTRVLNEHQWHWAFYAFREDSWDGMDYELGAKRHPTYWNRVANKNPFPGLDFYKRNALFDVIEHSLKNNTVTAAKSHK